MRCPSLFHFYRAYYGGVSQGKVQFAKAIVETGKQLEMIFGTKDLEGYSRYANRERAYALTKGFLRNFYELAFRHYGNQFFEELQIYKNRILLARELVGVRELNIPFVFCFEARKKRLVFMEYGKLEEATKWLPIFKTLVENFSLDHPLPDVETVTYWDLMRGTTNELSYPESFLAPRDKVVQTARKFIEQAIGRKR